MALPSFNKRSLAAVAVAASALATLPGAGSARTVQAACDQPYLPVYASETATYGQPHQTYPSTPVTPPTLGKDLSRKDVLEAAGTDMDGDGTADTITVESGTPPTIVVARGDGNLSLSQGADGVINLAPIGDLDGDGHDELLALARPLGPGTDRVFIVPGTTAVGSHQLSAVGIEVPDYQIVNVGPQLGGPGDDLAAIISTEMRSALVSGAAVMAAGPGGSFAAWPETRPIAGAVHGAYDLGDPLLSILAADMDASSTITGWILSQDTEETRFGYGPVATTNTGASIYETDLGPFLAAGDANRSESNSTLWRLDDPCAALPAATTPPPVSMPSGTPVSPSPAAPAAPISGRASYTG